MDKLTREYFIKIKEAALNIDEETKDKYQEQKKDIANYMSNYNEWLYLKEFISRDEEAKDLISHPILKRRAQELKLEVYTDEEGYECVREPVDYAIEKYPDAMIYWAADSHLKLIKERQNETDEEI